jgi:hypothetical protein
MHAWTLKFRVTPLAGGPPYEVTPPDMPVVCQPRESLIATEHEMLNREMRVTRHGVRLYVDVIYEFESGSTSEADLVNLLLNPHVQDDALVEISLNGGGHYEEAELTETAPEGTIAGKNIGSVYAMTWACVKPRAAFFIVGAGGWAP